MVIQEDEGRTLLLVQVVAAVGEVVCAEVASHGEGWEGAGDGEGDGGGFDHFDCSCSVDRSSSGRLDMKE